MGLEMTLEIGLTNLCNTDKLFRSKIVVIYPWFECLESVLDAVAELMGFNGKNELTKGRI